MRRKGEGKGRDIGAIILPTKGPNITTKMRYFVADGPKWIIGRKIE